MVACIGAICGEIQKATTNDPARLFDHAVFLMKWALLFGSFGGLIAKLRSDNRQYRLSRALRERDRFVDELGTYLSFILQGAAAALLVPLFLSIVSSDVLTESATNSLKLLEYTGLCILAAVFSRRFIDNLAEKAFEATERLQDEQERAAKVLSTVGEQSQAAKELADSGVVRDRAIDIAEDSLKDYNRYLDLRSKGGKGGDPDSANRRLEYLKLALAKIELATNNYFRSNRYLAFKANIVRKIYDETSDSSYLERAISAVNEALEIKGGQFFDELIPPTLYQNRACYTVLLEGDAKHIEEDIVAAVESEPSPQLRELRLRMVLRDSDLKDYTERDGFKTKLSSLV